MKITIYTVTECQFSKQLKNYLQANNLQYEEKNLELNKEWLSEMLAVSNNFAGTPVAKIEKDDDSIVVLKGFTKEEYDQVLGLTPSFQPTEQLIQTQQQSQQTQQQNSETPTSTENQSTNQPQTFPEQTLSEQNQPQSQSPTTTNDQSLESLQTTNLNQPTENTPSSQPDPMNNILERLEENTQTPSTQQSTYESNIIEKPVINQTQPPPPNTDLPNIPDLNLNNNQ